ncbi:MAG: ribosomal subunit interface protein [Bdellovibrionales bacterium RBG_16_40_8]|nr:MAG: ribosomal subunit interface protein [Bdellovibrionales bacterium RBG_16_40_8]
MTFDIKFKSIDHSQGLVEYVQERFLKLMKLAIRPLMVHVTFSEERFSRKAHVYIKGIKGGFRASGVSDSFHVSLDICLRKIKRQLEKEKSKIKHHHHYEHSSEAILEEMAKKIEKEVA